MSEAAPIVPRWEWRTFGDSFGSAEAELTRWMSTGESESDERYLLSIDGENVKIRDDLLDIKVLREVDHRGFERWEPTHKASFPLDHSTLAAAFAALRQPPPVLSRQSYSHDQFLGELIEPTDAIRIVSVHKRRVRYTHGDCMGELTDFDVDGKRLRTLALESTDPAAVAAQVGSLGLGDRINTSVPRALLTL
jgi:exopolyphosphatase / guanosine-5'-triphosphate,3'-diphosphate pyrophosphatase